MVRLHPRPFGIAVAGAGVFALATVASSIAVRWVTDEVIVPRFDEGSVGAGAVATGIALIITIGLVRAGAVVVRRVWASRAMWQISETLSDDVVDRLVDQPVSWHARHADGDLVARVGVDSDAAVSVLAPLPFASSTVLLVVVSSVWLLITDVVLGLVAIAVFPVLLALTVAYNHRVSGYYDEAQDHLGRLSAGVHESFEAVQLVKAYGAESRETERLSLVAGSVRDARMRAVRIRGTFEALLDMTPSLASVAIVLVGAIRVGDRALTVGELSSFIYLFTLLVLPLRVIGFALAEMPRSMAGHNRIRAVLGEPLEHDPRESIGEASSGVGVELDAVGFAYDESEDTKAVRDVSVQVPAGGVTAVVGSTGSGKSTLVELVAGLLAPTSGSVRVTPGRTAMVFQEPFLLSGTIRQNVAMADDHDDDAIWAALELAVADEFVRPLPAQLDEVVGERGVTLSGGQRQRIALARAFVRRPSLLILDDTTSALDPATEASILRNLRSANAGTTVLMVASRPSTIALADDVVFLGDGVVRAQGTHAALLTRELDYRQLVEAFETQRAADSEAPA